MRPENRDREVPTERFLVENKSRRFKALRDRDASESTLPGVRTSEAENAV
jgi:hypothetical protein